MVYSSAHLFGKAANSALFIARRALRIVPLFWLTVAWEIYRNEGGYAGNWKELFKTLFFVPYTNVWGTWQPIGYVGWTLNYEMLFYAIFAVALVLPRRIGGFALISAIALQALIGQAAQLGYFVLPFGVLRFWTEPIVLEFAFGCCLGFAYVQEIRLPRSVAIALVIGAMVALMLAPSNFYPRPIILGLPAAALVAAACLVRRPWHMGTSAAPFLLLGEASYAIYLVHLPARNYLVGLNFSTLVIFFSCIMVGVLVHAVIEKPLLFFGRACLSRARDGAESSHAVSSSPSTDQGAINSR